MHELDGQIQQQAASQRDTRVTVAEVANALQWPPLDPLPEGGIILAATPLGHPGDASMRLVSALGSADIIAAEDTRRTRNLARALGVEITGQVISNFDHNEQDRVEELIQAAKQGQRVLVVTDAGMPSVSDPGFPLTQAAQQSGVPLTCLPGPSAVPTALAISGLGMGKFCFDGFAPRKTGSKRSWLEGLLTEQRTVCFFESPHRIADTLALAAEVLGPEREAAVCREMTKRYEEVQRGSLAELAHWAAEGVKGEICVVIDGAAQVHTLTLEDAVEEVLVRKNAGVRLKQAAAEVAEATGLSKKELYDAVVNK